MHVITSRRLFQRHAQVPLAPDCPNICRIHAGSLGGPDSCARGSRRIDQFPANQAVFHFRCDVQMHHSRGVIQSEEVIANFGLVGEGFILGKVGGRQGVGVRVSAAVAKSLRTSRFGFGV